MSAARLAELPSSGIAIGRERENQGGAGRVLAYVWPADGRARVNEQLIAEGFARARDGSPNVKYAERFAQAERAARDGGLGLWSI